MFCPFAYSFIAKCCFDGIAWVCWISDCWHVIGRWLLLIDYFCVIGIFVFDQANSAWPSLHGLAKWQLAMVAATAREDDEFCITVGPFPGLLTYWPSRLKALAVNRAGRPFGVQEQNGILVNSKLLYCGSCCCCYYYCCYCCCCPYYNYYYN